MKNGKQQTKFPSTWTAHSSQSLSPVVRDLVRATPFTHMEMLPPLQRMFMLSSPQVLRRGRPSCNQNLHKDVQGLDVIEPRKLYPHDHLREFAATTSITQRGVQQMASKPQHTKTEPHVLRRSTALLTSASSLLGAELRVMLRLCLSASLIRNG